MSLIVVGSIALDDLQTPVGKAENVIGGSASFISIAASFFSDKVNLIGVVGEDFGDENLQKLKNHNIDLNGLQIKKGEKTFRWGGKYHDDMNGRDTLYTELNAFESFDPIIPDDLKDTQYVVLGNIGPDLQLKVLEQLNKPKFVVADTMNLWIDNMKDDLIKVIGNVDALVINDSEARMLTNEQNLIKAGDKLKEMGPENVIIKKGEHGAVFFYKDKLFTAPAYPIRGLVDPTGAGDSFAGGFAGFLQKYDDISFENVKRAVVYGSAMASFTCEDFSTRRLESISLEQVKERFKEFKEISGFDDHD